MVLDTSREEFEDLLRKKKHATSFEPLRETDESFAKTSLSQQINRTKGRKRAAESAPAAGYMSILSEPQTGSTAIVIMLCVQECRKGLSGQQQCVELTRVQKKKMRRFP